MSNLPPEVVKKLLALINQNSDGTIAVPDRDAFVDFVKEYGSKYPEIQEMVKLDEAAVQMYYEETGRVPAGVKATRIVKRPDSNIAEMQVNYGKDDP
jgi:hypothetical protein